ncbi:hypothetical protein [Olleya sp. YS]|uniref:hypothetical protein n=1 Tax=Olleya sp. YS TaxID=3028318 RepID=UPI0024343D81|nr:hypothetical protein [Olleya sp. YS]WGD34146.1 hypothetical protein Ollyesu_10200 [Olleya sp. YS]
MKKLLFILITFSSFAYSQEKEKKITFLDINLNPITENEFHVKSNSNLYQANYIVNDSIIINKLEYRYEFGELSATELSQTQYLLKKQFGDLDFKKNIIISYIDTLYGYNELVNNTFVRRMYDFSSNSTLKDYNTRRDQFDKQQKKCSKYAKKENFIALYTYGVMNNFTYKSKNHKKQKLSKALISKFFKHKKGGFVILKPDGNFFYYRYLSQDYVTKFLNESWTKFKNDIETAKLDLRFNNINFIVEMKESQKNKRRKEIELNRSRNQRPSNKRLDRSQIRHSNHTRVIRGRTIQPKPSCFTGRNF